MAQLENENVSSTTSAAWISLRYPVFRYLWIATVVSNTGSWMYSAASGWLMTSLNGDPLIVSLVQVANSLPLFLFALPAGALADITDKRRLILALEILTTVFSVLFATLVTLRLVTPTVLLWFLFLIASLGAIESPAWQAIVPLLVPAKALSSAVATNSVGVNISRVLGPALAGIVILSLGIAAPFWLDAFSNLGVIAVIFWCRVSERRVHALPAEHLLSAMSAGARYVRNNPRLRATLARAVGFFLPASAYWALLPIVARIQLHGGPTLYGVLLGAIGVSGVGGALLLPGLKAKVGANWVVAAGEVGTAVALLLFGLAHNAPLAVLACLVAGFSWISVLATLNVSAQIALPDWVRGRGLAIYIAVFFGTMSVGSILWGFVAQHAGLPTAHFMAAGGAILALGATLRWKLYAGPQPDLTPSMDWPEPVLAQAVPDDLGPVLVTVEYCVAPVNRQAFLVGSVRLGQGRKRDGAYDWGIFEDTAHPGKLLETFLVDSWLEHLRQHRRVTNADRVAEEDLYKLLQEPPRVTHYVAAQATEADPREIRGPSGTSVNPN
jgi:MFS family permease